MKLAEAYGERGIRAEKPTELDAALKKRVETPGPVMFECRVGQLENCYPMIPSGAAHNEMILGDDADGASVSEEGKMLV